MKRAILLKEAKMAMEPGNDALIIVDVQIDFCPGGALPVPAGDEVVPVINALSARFEHVVATQDWHPAGHVSFASRYSNRAPGDTIETPSGPQVVWPDHCVQGNAGAAFHPELDTRKVRLIVRKGLRPDLDSYSAFFENDSRTPTGLAAALRELGVGRLFVAGLALDYCVAFTALDAARSGFTTLVITDACRGADVPVGSVNAALERLRAAGVTLCTAADVTA